MPAQITGNLLDALGADLKAGDVVLYPGATTDQDVRVEPDGDVRLGWWSLAIADLPDPYQVPAGPMRIVLTPRGTKALGGTQMEPIFRVRTVAHQFTEGESISWGQLLAGAVSAPLTPSQYDELVAMIEAGSGSYDDTALTGRVKALEDEPDPTWDTLAGKPAVIGAGTSATAARAAIGAGTSSLQLGTGSTTAKAGDWTPARADLDTSTRDSLAKADNASPAGHTHTAAQITDLTEATQDIVGALIKAGTGTVVTYDDAAGTFTISATATGGTTDPEIVRDVIGGALVAGTGIQITVNDAGDTITVASTAVQPTRQVTTGTGLAGGGDLSADRTIALTQATQDSLAKADAAVPSTRKVAGKALSADVTIGAADLSATGTRDGTKVLHDDNTWRVPAGGDAVDLTEGEGITLTPALDGTSVSISISQALGARIAATERESGVTPTPPMNGMKGWSTDFATINGANTALPLGVLHMVQIALPAPGETISNIWLAVATAGAGLTSVRAALYTLTGQQLVVASPAASSLQATGLRQLAIPATVVPDDKVFACWSVEGSTAPVIYRQTSFGANFGLSAAPYRVQTGGAVSGGALPASITPNGGAGVGWVVGVS